MEIFSKDTFELGEVRIILGKKGTGFVVMSGLGGGTC